MIQLTDKLIAVIIPVDAENIQCNIWSDDSTTVEFKSDLYEMEYDSFEIGVETENQLKEITISFEPIDFKIIGTITKDCTFDFDCEKYVRPVTFGLEYKGYFNHIAKGQDFRDIVESSFETKEESCISLLQSKGIFLENLNNEKLLILEKI